MAERKSGRRRFIEWTVKGGIALLAYDVANHGCYNQTQPKPEDKLGYEKAHAMPEETLFAYSTGYKFGYPKVPEGWGFVNFDGEQTLTTMLHEELAFFRRQSELQFYIQGDKHIHFPGIYVSSYIDSTGLLVPKISFKSGIMTAEEHVLIGHISEPLGSFSNIYPDIVRIFNESYPTAPTYYASLTVTETKGRLRSYRTINVTPLTMVQLSTPQPNPAPAPQPPN
jgi:hypothetical protein